MRLICLGFVLGGTARWTLLDSKHTMDQPQPCDPTTLELSWFLLWGLISGPNSTRLFGIHFPIRYLDSTLDLFVLLLCSIDTHVWDHWKILWEKLKVNSVEFQLCIMPSAKKTTIFAPSSIPQTPGSPVVWSEKSFGHVDHLWHYLYDADCYVWFW